MSKSYNDHRKLIEGMKKNSGAGYCYSLFYLSYICVKGLYCLCQLCVRENSPSKGYHIFYFSELALSSKETSPNSYKMDWAICFKIQTSTR